MPNETAKFVLLLLAMAVPLCAADPYVGTWKMNVPKMRVRERCATERTDCDHYESRDGSRS